MCFNMIIFKAYIFFSLPSQEEEKSSIACILFQKSLEERFPEVISHFAVDYFNHSHSLLFKAVALIYSRK